MQTEHLDVNDGYGHMYVAWNEPAVAPPGECLPHTEIWRRLARAMGLTEPALYDDDLTLARTLVESGDPTLEGITVERLRRAGLGAARPPRAAHRRSRTASRRRPAGCGCRRATRTSPPAEAAAPGEDRLALIAGASHWFLNSMFANAPAAAPPRRRAGRRPASRRRRGTRARGRRRGRDRQRARDRSGATLVIGPAARRGVAATTKGHWPKLLAGGANVNAVTEERDADIGGGAVFHDCSVWVRPAGVASGAAGRVAAWQAAG